MALQYVIFNNPIDYPDKFVVRRFLAGGGNVGAEFAAVGVVDTLEEARKLVPKEFSFKIPRLPQDEEQIEEVWMTPEIGKQITALMEKLQSAEGAGGDEATK